MKKVSIIVPVYNTENFLERCLNSLLKQTYDSIEIIIVNDGSPGNCRQVIELFRDYSDRIVYLEKENGGISSARNLGIKSSSGEYVVFCDSDDTVNQDWIKELVAAIEKHPRSLVTTGFYRVDENGLIISKHIVCEGFYYKDSYFDLTNAGLTGSVCNKIYNLELLRSNSISFNESVTYAEDALFNIDYLACVDNIYVSEKVSYNYYLYKSVKTLSSNVPYEKRAKIFEARIPLIRDDKLVEFNKSFFWSVLQELKDIPSWYINRPKYNYGKGILCDPVFQRLLVDYGKEYLDIKSYWLLKNKRLQMYIWFLQVLKNREV